MSEPVACPFCHRVDGLSIVTHFADELDPTHVFVRCAACEGRGPRILLASEIRELADVLPIEVEKAVIAWNGGRR